MPKRICLALCMALPLIACHKRIPQWYEYEPGWITQEYPPVQTRFLSGRVLAGDTGLQYVLVERMTPDFKKRLAVTVTNERGEFRLHGGAGQYYLRFRRRAFNDYLVPVVVTHSSRETLVVKLEPSN